MSHVDFSVSEITSAEEGTSSTPCTQKKDLNKLAQGTDYSWRRKREKGCDTPQMTDRTCWHTSAHRSKGIAFCVGVGVGLPSAQFRGSHHTVWCNLLLPAAASLTTPPGVIPLSACPPRAGRRSLPWNFVPSGKSQDEAKVISCLIVLLWLGTVLYHSFVSNPIHWVSADTDQVLIWHKLSPLSWNEMLIMQCSGCTLLNPAI